jgi:phage gp29-like protein
MKRTPTPPPSQAAALAVRAPFLPEDPTASTEVSDIADPTSPSGGVPLLQKIKAISRWRENYNPLRGLSLQRAIDLSECYYRGWMADLQWLYFFIEQTDADLFALVERRTSRLLEMDYVIKTAKDADKGLAQAQSEFLQEKFGMIDNLYEAIEHLAMASFRGYAHCEKWYEGGELVHLEIVDQWNAVRDGLRGAWKYNPHAAQVGFFGLDASLIMPKEQFLYREVRRPINRIALLKFLRANLSEKDWDAYIEIYGIPGGVLVGPPGIPAEKAAAYEAAAREIAEGGSGYAPNGSEWKPNDAPRGNQPFAERLSYLTEKLILAGTGGLLTMLTKSGSGTLAGNAHADVFEQIAKADARKISEDVNHQLVEDMLEEGFPGKDQVAYFELASTEETKVGEVVAHVVQLCSAGYIVDPAQVQEKTGYTVKLNPAGPAPDAGKEAGGIDGKNSDPVTGDPASIANRNSPAAAAGRDAIFLSASASKLTEAKKKVFAPLAARVAALAAIADPAEKAKAAARLKADSHALYAEALKGMPAIAEAYQAIIGTALADGLAEGAAARTPANGRKAPNSKKPGQGPRKRS